VAGCVDHFRVDRPHLKAITIFEQMVELRAVARDVGRVEHRPKDALYIANVLAD
jgi:hypothetical protein